MSGDHNLYQKWREHEAYAVPMTPDGVPLSKWGRHSEHEPFCYHDGRNIVGKEYADHSDVFPLYTSPPASKPLTDEQRRETISNAWNEYLRGEGYDSFSWYLSQAIEAAHGIKGDA